MILRVIIVIAVLVALVLILAAIKPKTFRIQRSISIDAPPERVFTLIDNLHYWARWAPQDRDDPCMRTTYSGPASGKGGFQSGLARGARAGDAC